MRSRESFGSTQASASGLALLGFAVSGLLLAFPGTLLPAWDYHLRPNYLAIGNYFLALNLGLLLAVALSSTVIRRSGANLVAMLACGVGMGSLCATAFVGPPSSEWSRVPVFLGLGFAGGALNTAIFHTISPAYRLAPAATVNLAGLFFGLGCSLSALVMAFTYYDSRLRWAPALLALLPGTFLCLLARFPVASPMLARPPGARQAMVGVSTLGAILLAMLLFFQFANEWSVAGWLPLFLIERLGISPSKALFALWGYWIALAAGRLAVQPLLSRVRPLRLLGASALTALFGCLILAFTNNMFGAILAVACLGFGFAPIYPLVVGKIGSSFPNYHPGLFNGIFSFGLTGGMLAPASVGYGSEYLGIRALMMVPVAGTILVLLLIGLVWLDARFTSREGS